tara:strand:- start:464 stop:724 length:261 start_codon:yes stop_codon:yes gene_type:complete
MNKANEDDLYDESMRNAYLLVTKQLSFSELVDYNGCSLPYHPKKRVNNDVINELIDYFCTLEEYEKCGELKKTKKNSRSKKNFINL